MSWHTFDSGKAIGGVGSENGTIIRDEEYGDDARITLEQGGSSAPFAITCGICGWMLHTRFFSTDSEARLEFKKMKEALACIVATIPLATDSDADSKSQVVKQAVEFFIETFP